LVYHAEEAVEEMDEMDEKLKLLMKLLLYS
jgi:hypothetical protein